jgi:hypothetical protein
MREIRHPKHLLFHLSQVHRTTVILKVKFLYLKIKELNCMNDTKNTTSPPKAPFPPPIREIKDGSPTKKKEKS